MRLAQGGLNAPRTLCARERRLQEAMDTARTDENARNVEKLAAARMRIEALLKLIPETES
mgnify:CR=1 FL=1